MATAVAAWLNRIDLAAEIDGVPPTFDKTVHLSVLVRKLIEGWLTDLVGSTVVETINTELKANPNAELTSLTQPTQDWLALMTPFLANAAWARWVLHGNANYTDTGTYSKRDEVTEGISDKQRTELSRDYNNDAERLAVKLAKKAAATNGACSTTISSGRTNLTTVRGRRQSRFD